MPMTWDQYKGSVDWNNADVTHGFSELAKRMGYGGPVYQAAGERYMGEGESGPMYSQNYGANSALDSLLAGYSFDTGKDSGGNLAMDVYGPDGQLFSGDNRIGSKPGTGFKIAKTAIPALAAAGFGVGALGALSGGGAAASGAAAGSGGTGFGLAGAGAGIAPMTAGEIAFGALTPEMVSAAGLGASGQVAGALGGAGLLGSGVAGVAQGVAPGVAQGVAGIAPSVAVDSLAPLTAAEVASASLTPSVSNALGGMGLLNSLKSGAGSMYDYLKDKNNKTESQALFGGLGALLSAGGGGGGGSPAPEVYGAPQQWNSALQQGLLSTQPKTKMPTGLLGGGGNAGAGAWRYMGK